MIVLFKETYKNPKVLGLNIGYWSRMLKRMRIENYERVRMNYPFENRKDIPIYVCTDGQRFLRIIQYDVYESDDYEKYAYITAWKDVYCYNDIEYPELVICVLLTKEYTPRIKKLISYWFGQDEEKVDSMIEEIYSLQENNVEKLGT